MTILRIPLTTSSPHFEQEIQLDGVAYRMVIHWNEREEAFYLDLLDDDNVSIISGRKMLPDWPLLHRCRDARKPAGQLFVVDLTGNGEPPGLNDLDERVVLLYYDAVSFAELQA